MNSVFGYHDKSVTCPMTVGHMWGALTSGFAFGFGHTPHVTSSHGTGYTFAIITSTSFIIQYINNEKAYFRSSCAVNNSSATA